MEGTENLAQILSCCNADQVAQLAKVNPEFPNSPDSNGLYPLHYAALYGNNEVLKCLITQYGSNFNCVTSEKTTPLHFAARNGSLECVKILLDFNAPANEADQMGWTPLHYACYRGHTDIAMQLIRKGSNLNLSTVEGYTPLHISCYRGNIKIMEDLIGKGADVNAKDKHGKTPLELLQLFKLEYSVPASPPIVDNNVSNTKTKRRNIDDEDSIGTHSMSDRESITPPSIVEFSPINEDSLSAYDIHLSSSTTNIQDSSKPKNKQKRRDDYEEDSDDDNDDNYEDSNDSNKKKLKKKDEHNTITTTTTSSTVKAPLQLTLKVGSNKHSDPKHSKLSTASSTPSLHLSLPISSPKSTSSLHTKSDRSDLSEIPASSIPPTKKQRHSNAGNNAIPLPQEIVPEEAQKKQPKSNKKASKRSSMSITSGPSSPPLSNTNVSRSIAASITSSHSSRTFSSSSSSSSLISLDDDPLFSVCDCFKLIMSSACPYEVKKAIKSTNSALKEKIEYKLDSHNTKICRSIIDKLREIDTNKIFEEPVTVKIAPDYFRYVKSPMDIKTLEDYVIRKKIISVKEFIIWGRQIWQSCFTFNTKKDPFFTVGKEYSLKFESCIRTADWKRESDPDKVLDEAITSWSKIIEELDSETCEKILNHAGVTDLDPYNYFDDIRVGFFSIPTRDLKYKEE